MKSVTTRPSKDCGATVKQWSKATGQSRELTEEALSHLYEGKVEKAYSRDEDQLEQRRPLMQKWSEFLDSAESSIWRCVG
jgi:hypothetical protein